MYIGNAQTEARNGYKALIARQRQHRARRFAQRVIGLVCGYFVQKAAYECIIQGALYLMLVLNIVNASVYLSSMHVCLLYCHRNTANLDG